MELPISLSLVMAVTIGGLFACGLYMVLRRSVVKLIIGLALFTHATNLLIFNSGGLTRGRPPLIPADATSIEPPFADPIPQALILTAIVIAFGLQAFALVLLKRTYQLLKTEDLDELNLTDRLAPHLSKPSDQPEAISGGESEP